MIILGVDSSAVSAGVAVVKDGRLLSEGFVNVGLTHSQTLLPLISDTIKRTGMSITDIDYIAVSAGPGSFTGVRIGVATVKGLAFANDTPCVPVSTLEAIAYGAKGCDGYICACMDARRQQVYNAIFLQSGDELTRMTDDRAISIDDLRGELSGYDGDIWMCGDGAELCCQSISGECIKLAPERIRYQNGYGVAMAAMAKIEREEVCTPAELMPTYLRLPQAERELNNRKK